MFLELMLISAWPFWLLASVLIGLECLALTYADDRGGPLALAMAGLAFAVLFTDAFTGARLFWLGVGVIGYIAAGVAWAFKKWWDYVVTAGATARKEFNARSPGKGDTWGEVVARSKPTAAGNKQRIVNYMALWPFSFGWWVLTYPRRAFVWTYGRLSTVFDRMAAQAFKA